MDWIGLAQGRGMFSGSCECGNKPQVSNKSGKYIN